MARRGLGAPDVRTIRHHRKGVFLGAVCAFGCGVSGAIPPDDAHVDMRMEELIRSLKAAQVVDGTKRGAFSDELDGVHAGGVTALVTFALLSAGVPWHDETIERAVRYLAEHPLPGTYSRSLRAGVWALLASRTGEDERRREYRRLLQADTDWLVGAIKSDGFYGYDAEGTSGDHSCSQFAVLGLWAAETASAEVPDAHWERILRHWLTHQNDDGSWSYRGESAGTATMTTAGVNTLLVTMSQHLVRKEPPYTRLHGVPSRGRGSEDVERALRAAQRGFGWLAEHDLLAGGPYQLFGLERLGVASGRKLIGSVDWYRAGVQSISPGQSGTINEAFHLLFLTYGRAPVLFAKLRYGASEDWNRYYRDLHFLTSHLSAKHERIYKWQVVSVEAPLSDWLDAPILLISGFDRPSLSPAQKLRLREYVDAGGTIFAHADLASERFSSGFRQICAEVFADRAWTFSALPPAHPVYTALPSEESSKLAGELRIEGIGDDRRTCVYLCPTDIAGAWHQNLDERHPDLFNIMTNLRLCAAPEYPHLPKRLRPPELSGPAAPARGHLMIASLCPGRGRETTAGRWDAIARRLDHETGLSLVTCDLSDLAPDAAVDLVYVEARGEADPDASTRDRLVELARGGALIWIETPSFSPSSDDAAHRLLGVLAERLGGSRREFPADHPVLTGEIPGGTRLGDFAPNRWGRSALKGTGPRIEAVEVGGRPVVILTSFDLLATGSGAFLYETPAYGPRESAALLRNLVLWRYDSASDDPRSVVIQEVIRTRSTGSLADSIRRWANAGTFSAAVSGLAALRRLRSDDPQTKDLTDAVLGALRDGMTVARRAGRTADAGYLDLMMYAIAPDAASGPTRLSDPTPARPAQTSRERGVYTVAPVELPEGLSGIVIQYNNAAADARSLLAEWFKLDALSQGLTADLKEMVAEMKELDRKAAELVARQGGRGGGGQRGGPEFEKIARQREALEAQMSTFRVRLREAEQDMKRIVDALAPKRSELAVFGVTQEKDRFQLAGASGTNAP
ncbi:MAG: DUF4159 domain-containing protein [Planctomycetia bacterium]|nr:MAG: DUF4159 domain-containing protein [Planctomycetota bacterium]KAB2949741.1 MAG: DUF4159 domain-containing protein [Phycisphaerae bacterium]MBE7457499.1 DUF4159 domain-containing protein [Planctomycetia bacterium]MCQ3921692.1 hypothetical protein [Planctomycetota bacterium]